MLHDLYGTEADELLHDTAAESVPRRARGGAGRHGNRTDRGFRPGAARSAFLQPYPQSLTHGVSPCFAEPSAPSLPLAVVAAAGLRPGGQAPEHRLHLDRIVVEPHGRTGSPWSTTSSKPTGVPVKPFFASDYAGIIEAMRFNKVQIAWFGNKSAIEAVDRAQRRSIRLGDRQGRQPRLLVAADRQQGQPR